MVDLRLSRLPVHLREQCPVMESIGIAHTVTHILLPMIKPKCVSLRECDGVAASCTR